MKLRKSKPKKKESRGRRILKRSLWVVFVLFMLMNIMAAFHAYKFTHLDPTLNTKTKEPGALSKSEKLSALFFGVNNPKPRNNLKPTVAYETIELQSNKKLECWKITQKNALGTVAIFHGYGGNKSAMLDKAAVFGKLGYSTLLVDFMGSGDSEGNQTTIGFYEAEEVKTCYDYLEKSGEKNIYLFGTSMGAVAIMKSVNDYQLQPKGIILECPFGSLYQTVAARFNTMKIPTFPMAHLVVFWGGVENGFWAFGHNPTEYAKKIKCPTLLLYGAKDQKVSRKEIDEIYQNLKGKKKLKIYPNAGHENYLTKYELRWTNDVSGFLMNYQ